MVNTRKDGRGDGGMDERKIRLVKKSIEGFLGGGKDGVSG